MIATVPSCNRRDEQHRHVNSAATGGMKGLDCLETMNKCREKHSVLGFRSPMAVDAAGGMSCFFLLVERAPRGRPTSDTRHVNRTSALASF